MQEGTGAGSRAGQMGCTLQGVYEKNGDGDGVVGILLWWLVLGWTEERKWAGWLALPKLRVKGHGR